MSKTTETTAAGAGLSVDEQLELFTAGTVQVESVPELRAKIETGRPLRVKLGCDPSAPDLHVGHGTVLKRLRRLQDIGHHMIFIVGDFTARIGDPSGKSKTRPMLTEEEVTRNAQTYVEQVGGILDTGKCELRYNSEWFEELGAGGLMELASHYTLARMLEREDFSSRMAANAPLSIRELLYPLVQGYDSVAIAADVEVGGTDQTFNLLVGRDIQRSYAMEPQVVMTYPLLVGLDGKEKMSKSLGNAVGIAEPPKEMFGKLMSIPDELMPQYYELLLGKTPSEVQQLQEAIQSGQLHPREAKADLAEAVVAMYHSPEAAEQARAEFDRVFAGRQLPTEIPHLTLSLKDLPGGTIGTVELVLAAGFAESKAEARRLIRQKAVSINDEIVTDEMAQLEVKTGDILRVGKRRFARIIISDEE